MIWCAGWLKNGGYTDSFKEIGDRFDIDLAILESAIGPHTKLALVIESILSERKGICLNVDGANAGLLSDLGFDSKLGIGIFMIGRLPGLVAHSFEEMKEEDKFRRFCDLEDIVYEGLQNKSLK